VAACASVSKGEARRLVDQGGVKLDGVKVTDPAREIILGRREQILQVGKRKYFRVAFEKE